MLACRRGPISRVAAAGSAVAVILLIWAIAPLFTGGARAFDLQPRPDSVEYADGAWQLGHGHPYVTFYNERLNAFGRKSYPPRYPFGTSLALAPFAAIDNRFPQGPQLGARVISALYVVSVAAAAWLLGGPWAAALAVLMVGLSPFALGSSQLILSDALAALLSVGMLIALTFRSRASAAVAGALGGALLCVRLIGVVSLIPLAFVLRGRQRIIALAAAAPFIAALAIYQWHEFGAPWLTGYSYWLPGVHNFGLSFALGATPGDGPFVYPDKLGGSLLRAACPCGVGGPMSALPNLWFYPAVLGGLFWVFAPPLTGLVGLVQMIRARSTPAAQFGLWTAALSLVLLTFYFYTGARFVAPAASMLTIYAAAAFVKLVPRLKAPARAARERSLRRFNCWGRRGEAALARIPASLRGPLVPATIAVLLLARLALGLYDVGSLGVNYDESLFVNAATLRIPGMYLLHSVGGVPLMVFPYIGALKSWLYTPIFAIFGESPASIRDPMVILTTAGLLLLFVAVDRLVNRPVALLTLALMAFESSVFWLTRNDVGPSAIDFTLRGAVLLCIALMVRAWSLRTVLALLTVLALGIFNKLDFVWTANDVVLCSIVVGIKWRRELRHHRRVLLTWISGLAVIYAVFGWYYISQHIAAAADPYQTLLGQPWYVFWNGMKQTLSGVWFYNYVFGPLPTRDAVVWLLLALFASGWVASLLRPYRSMAINLLALSTAVTWLQILATPQATAGWHYVYAFPTVLIVAAYGVYVAFALLLRRRVLIGAGVAAAAALGLLYEGLLTGRYFTSLQRPPTNVGWTPQVYALSSYLERHPGTIFAADWGINNPLFALHPERSRYFEMAFELNGPPTPQGLSTVRSELASAEPDDLVVTHPRRVEVFGSADQNLMAAARGRLHLVRTFSDGRGRVFDVYRYR